jgi:hypothetical protein
MRRRLVDRRGRHRLHQQGRHRAGRRPAHESLQITQPIPVVTPPPRRRHSAEARVYAAITPAAWWEGGRA